MQSYSSKYYNSITWHNKSIAMRMRIYNKYRRCEEILQQRSNEVIKFSCIESLRLSSGNQNLNLDDWLNNSCLVRSENLRLEWFKSTVYLLLKFQDNVLVLVCACSCNE